MKTLIPNHVNRHGFIYIILLYCIYLPNYNPANRDDPAEMPGRAAERGNRRQRRRRSVIGRYGDVDGKDDGNNNNNYYYRYYPLAWVSRRVIKSGRLSSSRHRPSRRVLYT